MEQFFCTELLLGKEKLRKLQDSFVVIVGIGAVGGYALEALARLGVRRFRIVDFDTVKITNLNRHLLALHSTVGEDKVCLAGNRVLDINPHCQVEMIKNFTGIESIESLTKNDPDLVIDAIDSLNPKVQLLSACYKQGVRVVSSMGAALKTDPSLVRRGDISQATNCPLASRLRKRLKKEGIENGISCVYSLEKGFSSSHLPEIPFKEEIYARGRQRKKLGSLPTVTGIFGLMVAHYAMEILTGD